ncbi:MAG: diphthine--ammonia ligase [Thaumarchaeota archaeon]|nr:diphthine--ammonia ligase [Nitrososphaerota archaeon]
MILVEKVLLCWSGGKDSALALYEIQRAGGYEVVALLTTVTEDYDRISMHGVRRCLLEQQAASLGLPLEIVFIPKDCSNEVYELRMRDALHKMKSRGVSTIVFGDIFLEDLWKYRKANLERIGLKAVFPLWKQNTVDLAHRFINLGFKAVLACVDNHHLDGSFAGRLFDEELLSQLPSSADPCGENGEFHTFVFDGPIFQRPVLFKVGETVLRDNRFYYCDLVPSSHAIP